MKTALVLACDDNYIPYTAVVARRIAGYATEKFPIIVVSDGVSDENKALARKFCPKLVSSRHHRCLGVRCLSAA